MRIGKVFGIFLLALGIVLLIDVFANIWWFLWHYLWPVVLIAAGILILTHTRRK